LPGQPRFSPPRCSPLLPAVYRCAGTWLVHGCRRSDVTESGVVRLGSSRRRGPDRRRRPDRSSASSSGG